MYSLILSLYLGRELLGLVVGVDVTFKENATLFKVIISFYIPTSNVLKFQLISLFLI